MQAKISSTTIKQLSPGDKAFEVVDTEIKGFLLRVQPTGRMTFYFSYRTNAAKRKRIKIGVLGPALTIGQARDIALAYAGDVSKGVDIQGEKLSSRNKAKAQLKNTLTTFLEDIYEPWALVNTKSGKQTITTVKRTFPDYLNKPMSEIQLNQIERWRTEKLNDGLKPSTINRVVNALRGVLTKAVEWGAISEHPLAKLKNSSWTKARKPAS